MLAPPLFPPAPDAPPTPLFPSPTSPNPRAPASHPGHYAQSLPNFSTTPPRLPISQTPPTPSPHRYHLIKSRLPLNPLDATLLQVFIPKDFKSFIRNTYKKSGGPLRLWLTRFEPLVLVSYLSAASQNSLGPIPFNIPNFNAFRKITPAPLAAHLQSSPTPETVPAAAPALSPLRLSVC